MLVSSFNAFHKFRGSLQKIYVHYGHSGSGAVFVDENALRWALKQ